MLLKQVLIFLLETFLGLFALALLVRFYLQLMRAPARNPLSTFLGALTNWIVVPARRIIPGLFRVDLSTLVLAWLTQLILIFAVWSIAGGPIGLSGFALAAIAAAIAIVRLSIYIVMVTVIVQAVLTWVAPYSPVMPLLNSLTRPFLLVFAKRVPPIGNVDLSPIFVIVTCQLLLFVAGWAESQLLGMGMR